MGGLSVAWAIFKACAAGAVAAAAIISLVVAAGWLCRKVGCAAIAGVAKLALSLLPTDWSKDKRVGAVVFCGEVWYDVPRAANWMTLDRWGLIQCWQARPEYCSTDGEWYSHQLNQPFGIGYMTPEWTAPYARLPQPPIVALPDDIYDVQTQSSS